MGNKEYESIITLNKNELTINDKFEIIIKELKEIKNKIINDKIKEIEKLVFDLKNTVNETINKNKKSIKSLIYIILENQKSVKRNKKDIEYLKEEIYNYKIKSKICKLISIRGKIGYGFLMKLYKGDNPFYCILTNFIDNNMLNENIDIFYDDKNININLNKKERYILNYSFDSL